MTEFEFHRLLVWGMLGVAAVTFGYLFRRTAPYGRHYAGSGWGPDISSKVGWVVMEWP
ncbi:MAG: 3-oxo-5-alpha-steroid 4-dehydrogenase, partial [Acidobacteria bacterium]|nr:3-oxo-5-alpha-steroid 4-dehydrogenase [Acidobacteriota bacterium]